MRSPARAYFDFLLELFRLLETNGDLSTVTTGSLPENLPSVDGGGRGLCFRPSEIDENSPDPKDAGSTSGPVNWIGTFEIEVFTSDAGGDFDPNRDPISGTDLDPSVLDLHSTVAAAIDWNLANRAPNVEAWHWKPTKLLYLEEFPRQIALMILEIETNAPRFTRSVAAVGTPGLVPF